METNKQPLTAEEFTREKIREKKKIEGQMLALWQYTLSGEDCLRWSHEFNESQTKPLLEEISKLKEEKEALQKEHDRYKELFYDYGTEVDNLQEERRQLEQSLSLSKKENEELKFKLNNINDSFCELREINSVRFDGITHANEHIEDLQSELTSVKEQLQKVTDVLESCKNGMEWNKEEFPEDWTNSGGDMLNEITEALTNYKLKD